MDCSDCRGKEQATHLSCWAGYWFVGLLQWRGGEAIAVDESEVAGAHRNDALVRDECLLHNVHPIQADWHCWHQAAHKHLLHDQTKEIIKELAYHETKRTFPLTSTLSFACLSQTLGTCSLKSQLSSLKERDKLQVTLILLLGVNLLPQH